MPQPQPRFAHTPDSLLANRPMRSLPPWDRDREERQLVAMLVAFRPGGGVVSGDELAQLLRPQYDQSVSVVARWVVQRTIVSLSWRGQTLIPLFQFDRECMQLRVGLTCVVRELSDAFDDWDLGLWFTQPNCWLNDATPAEAMAGDPAMVLQAARTDRFIALG